MKYVDGYVLAIPEANLGLYRERGSYAGSPIEKTDGKRRHAIRHEANVLWRVQIDS